VTSVWRTDDGRYFLIPDHEPANPGTLAISDALGRSRNVAPEAVAAFEVTEEQARRWTRDQLRRTLEELKEGLDDALGKLREKLAAIERQPVREGTSVTAEAPAVLFRLLKQLPRIIGESLSGDETRLEGARQGMRDLQHGLKEAGIDLDQRFTGFPDRLAALRKEAEQKR
jgi:hypothetical protein